MASLNITELDLFEPTLEFRIGNEEYDFHNDFSCAGIHFDNSDLILEFKGDHYDKSASFIFKNAKIKSTKYATPDNEKSNYFNQFPEM